MGHIARMGEMTNLLNNLVQKTEREGISLDVQTQVEGLEMSLKEMWTGLDCFEQRQMVNKCRLDKCAEDKHRY